MQHSRITAKKKSSPIALEVSQDDQASQHRVRRGGRETTRADGRHPRSITAFIVAVRSESLGNQLTAEFPGTI
jgi:hypothetical protein